MEPIAEFSIKSLKEGQNRGFDPSLIKFFIKSLLARHISETTLKLGGIFATSSFHLLNFKNIKI
jgi:hypothetical protein